MSYRRAPSSALLGSGNGDGSRHSNGSRFGCCLRPWQAVAGFCFLGCLGLHLLLSLGRSTVTLHEVYESAAAASQVDVGGHTSSSSSSTAAAGVVSTPHRSFIQDAAQVAERMFLRQLQPDAMHPGMRFIPKVIHITWKSFSDLPLNLQVNIDSWGMTNPGWEVRLYNNSVAEQYVVQHFPEYVKAYKGLSKAVAQADFFR